MPTETEGASAPTNTPASSNNAEPQTFSLEYVRELRAENKGWRLKVSEYEGKVTAAEAAAAKAQTEAQEHVSKAQQSANDRIVRAELKAIAVKAGIRDLDGLKLADLSKVKLNDAGDVEGAEALIESLKEAKPWLFADSAASTGTTSSTKKAPAASPTGPKKASDLSDSEFEVELARLTGKRR